MSVEINDEVRLSLTEAGIGKAYHFKTLDDLGAAGRGALEWMKRNSEALRRGTWSAVFDGTGTTDVLKLMARGMHINGIGCRVLPLVRMRRVVNDAEFREMCHEIDCLVLLNAQDRHRSNPLHPAVAAEVEYLIRERHEANKLTFVQVAFSGEAEGHDSYWSDEFWDMLGGWDRVTPEDLIEGGRSK